MCRWYRVRSVLILGGLVLLASPPLASDCFMSLHDLSLWHGIHEAQLIVVGKTVDVQVNELAVAFDHASVRGMYLLSRLGLEVSLPTIDPLAAVTLDVDKTLEGTPGSWVTFRVGGVTTEDRPSLSYPAIFFLHREGGTWRSTRYPIFYDSPEELADLRRLIERALALGPSAGEVEKQDWHVEAAVRPTTRRYAMFGLGRGSELPEPVLQRLAEGFVADPAPGEAFYQMLTLLAAYPSPEVDRAALGGWLALPRSSMREQTRPLVEARFGGPIKVMPPSGE